MKITFIFRYNYIFNMMIFYCCGMYFFYFINNMNQIWFDMNKLESNVPLYMYKKCITEVQALKKVNS
jgi:hypothetical protein